MIKRPSPEQIRAARERAGHSQAAAAAAIGASRRTWQDWEAGIARMPAGLYRLYLHLAGIERLPFGTAP